MQDKPDLTKNQQITLDALTVASTPMTAYALLDELRPTGIRAPLQVYRALDRLLELGLVHKLESINAYMTCTHAHHDHHHPHGVAAFAICNNCGQVSEFEDSAIEARLDDWTRNHGFKPVRSSIELRGLCAVCQGEKAA